MLFPIFSSKIPIDFHTVPVQWNKSSVCECGQEEVASSKAIFFLLILRSNSKKVSPLICFLVKSLTRRCNVLDHILFFPFPLQLTMLLTLFIHFLFIHDMQKWPTLYEAIMQRYLCFLRVDHVSSGIKSSDYFAGSATTHTPCAALVHRRERIRATRKLCCLNLQSRRAVAVPWLHAWDPLCQ